MPTLALSSPEMIENGEPVLALSTVYQAGTPLWVVKHSDKPDVPTLHLAYDGQHYDSVRMADDYGERLKSCCLQHISCTLCIVLSACHHIHAVPKALAHPSLYSSPDLAWCQCPPR
jgi:hypothetical protein